MKAPLNASAAGQVAKNLRSWYREASRRAVYPTHTQIVNPGLCHDVLERLSPSLQRHRGCDIIDINPGVGLWSHHLHEALQPRRHILAEPDRDLFAPHLNPLLEQPGSRYKWTDKGLKDILSDDGLLGPSPAMTRHEAFRTENPGLLVTINFSRHKIVHGGNSVKSEAHFFHDLYVSLFGLQSDFFQRGLFRVLAWVPDEHKFAVLPRAVASRSKQSSRYEAFADVKEIAGGPEGDMESKRNHRTYAVHIEDMQAMRQAETASGLVVPAQRVEATPPPPAVHIHPSVDSWKATENIDRPKFLDELLALDSQVEKDHPEIYEKHKPLWLRADQRSGGRKYVPNDLVKQWLILYARARTLHSTYWKHLRIAEEQRAIEREWHLADQHGNPEALADLKRRHEAQIAAINKLSPKNAIFVRKAIDDYRAFDMRATSWYRRPYNPLAVNQQDFGRPKTTFYGTANLALLDIEPKPSFREVFDTDTKWACLDYIFLRLFAAPMRDVRTALEQIVPGAVDEFIKTVPSLTDANKGGWYDLSEIRIRSLPIEVLVDIVLAYEKWPFRLSEELLWNDAARIT